MCEHERLRTVGDDVFCCNCGEKLPLEFLMNKGKPVEPDPVQEKPTKPSEEPVPEEPADKQPEPAEKPAETAEKPKKKAPAKKNTKTKKDGE